MSKDRMSCPMTQPSQQVVLDKVDGGATAMAWQLFWPKKV